jgi:hypothetical protein
MSFIGENHMQVSLLFVVFLTIDTFQHNIRFIRLFNDDHVEHIAFFHGHCFWKRRFAYFTLKLREVVGDDDVAEFLFYFTVNPVFETANMNELARTFASARSDQRVFFSRFLTKTYFAATCETLINSVVSRVEFQMRGLFANLRDERGTDFQNNILDSS